MRLFIPALALVVSVGLLAAPVSAQDIGPTGPIPYDIVESWAKPFAGEGFAFGGNSGVYAESPDRIIVLQRGETRLPDPVPPEFDGWAGPLWNVLSGRGRTWQNCIYVLDRDGNLIEVWDQWDYLFEGSEGPGPHRIRVSPYDPERRIWIVHETAHQIFVLSNDGKELLRTFGERNVSGTDETHFGLPQDVGFLPDGRVLIADGYENSRVVVLDADWNYQTEFGGPGDGPGEFQIVHSIAMAPGGRILVADRDNRRVQIFSQSDYSYMGGDSNRSSGPRHHRERKPRVRLGCRAPEAQAVRPGREPGLYVVCAGPGVSPLVPRDALDRGRLGRQPVRGRQSERPDPEIRPEAGRRSEPSGRSALHPSLIWSSSRPGLHQMPRTSVDDEYRARISAMTVAERIRRAEALFTLAGAQSQLRRSGRLPLFFEPS